MINNRIIGNSFRQIMTAYIVSGISSMLCILIDSAIIGKFLGNDAVAAMGLVNPVIDFCETVAGIFGPGLGIICSRYAGKGDKEGIRKAFSIVMITTVIISVTVALLLFLLAPAVSGFLCMNAENPDIRTGTLSYLRGIVPGVIFVSVNSALTGVLIIDNGRKRTIIATVAVLIADVMFDLINVLLLDLGMFGMALATSISSCIGVIILMLHFRRSSRMIGFVRSGLDMGDLRDSFMSGFSVALRNRSKIA